MSQTTLNSFFQARKKPTGQPLKQKIKSSVQDVTDTQIEKPFLKLESTPECKKRAISLDRTSKKEAFEKYAQVTPQKEIDDQAQQAHRRAASCSRISKGESSARKKLDLTAIKKTSKANVTFLKQGNLSPHKAKSPFKVEKRSLLSPRRLEAIEALVSSSPSKKPPPSPRGTPEKASPADVKKRLGNTNSLATLQARLKSLSESGSEDQAKAAGARKALFVDGETTKTSPSLSRKGLDIDVQVRNKPAVASSPIKASPRKQALEKAEKEKIKELRQPSVTLPLPQSYKDIALTFGKLDDIVAMRYNRSQAISLAAIKADVQIALRKSLTDHHIQQIRNVLPSAFIFTWEPKKDSRGRPTQSFELYIAPNIDGQAHMNHTILEQRKKLFTHSLLTIVQDHHQNFLLSRGIQGVDDTVIHRWDKEFDVNSCPDLDTIDYPPKPLVESPERNPQAMLAKINGLNQSVEKALHRVIEVTTPSKMTPVTKAVEDDIKLDPSLRDLPPHLLAKIKAQERDRRIREMTMDKTKQKEIEMLEELLHKRVFFSASIPVLGF